MPDRDDVERLLADLRAAGVGRGDLVALAVAPGVGLGVAAGGFGSALATAEPADAVGRIESELAPRWVWWSNETPAVLTAAGVRVARCWDLAAVHRLLFGGWRAEPSLVWAALHGLSPATIPAAGQLDLDGADDGANNAVRPDGHLRSEWVAGGWTRDPYRLARWAAAARATADLQRRRLEELPVGGDSAATARAESAAELLCVELAADGLPIDVEQAEHIIASFVGPRPRNDQDANGARRQRDAAVTALAPAGAAVDLRNPAQVRTLLAGVGIEVPDTRSWRLETRRDAHPVVDALLTWRKAERIATTYGYRWLDAHVGADNRLRGAWNASDGAAGRMTAQAGLHNLPGEMRVAVAAEDGHVLVRADLGQIEPRVLAAVSGDPALAQATLDDDLYAPVAARLGVERSVAKVAVLAAMYGQTSGPAGEALKGLQSAYPVAMRFLVEAYDAGRAGRDLRTYGGRLVAMPPIPGGLDERSRRSATAARGRFARNAVVQGAAAELFKAWAVTVRARVAPLGGRIVLCLHDELLVHAPAGGGDDVARLLARGLQDAARRWAPEASVRFVAEVTIVRRWSEAGHGPAPV